MSATGSTFGEEANFESPELAALDFVEIRPLCDNSGLRPRNCEASNLAANANASQQDSRRVNFELSEALPNDKLIIGGRRLRREELVDGMCELGGKTPGSSLHPIPSSASWIIARAVRVSWELAGHNYCIRLQFEVRSSSWLASGASEHVTSNAFAETRLRNYGGHLPMAATTSTSHDVLGSPRICEKTCKFHMLETSEGHVLLHDTGLLCRVHFLLNPLPLRAPT